MHQIDVSSAPENWTSSRYSGQQGDCVQWRRARDGKAIEIRDSKNPDGPTLRALPESWRALVAFAAAYEV